MGECGGCAWCVNSAVPPTGRSVASHRAPVALCPPPPPWSLKFRPEYKAAGSVFERRLKDLGRFVFCVRYQTCVPRSQGPERWAI